MPNLLLVIITGPPCTGKTILGRQLASQLGLPLISKDDVKEPLFDTLGWSDKAWSRKLSQASYAVLFRLAGALLETGQSCILEGTFQSHDHSTAMLELKDRLGCQLIQVQCGAEGKVLVDRFLARWKSGTRHPGHADPQLFHEIHPDLQKGWYLPMDLPGPVYRLDATDFSTPTWVDAVDRLRCQVRELLAARKE